jgi:hypothetical protein
LEIPSSASTTALHFAYSLALIPHSLPSHRTHQILLSALAGNSSLSSALGEMKKTTRKILNYSIAVIVSLCCVCLVLVLAVASSDSTLSTSAPIQDTPLPLSSIIALTSSSAQTQTAISNPMPFSTTTLASTIEIAPTATIFIFQLQTNVVQLTEYIYSTNTPFSLATQQIQQTQPPSSGGKLCSCTGIDLDCKVEDFPTHSIAQACYEYCKSLGYGDIYGLDRENDGLACENLP